MREGTRVCVVTAILGLAFSTIFIIFLIFRLVRGLDFLGLLGYSSGSHFGMCLPEPFEMLDFPCGVLW